MVQRTDTDSTQDDGSQAALERLLAWARRGGSAPGPRADEEEPTREAPEVAFERERSRLHVGAVFHTSDLETGRTGVPEKTRRPAMVIRSDIRLDDRADVGLTRIVSLCPRRSWKDEWGVPPAKLAMKKVWREKCVYTPADVLPALNKPGIFEVENYRIIRVPVRRLLGRFVGWLPTDIATLIAIEYGVQMPEPYPPCSR